MSSKEKLVLEKEMSKTLRNQISDLKNNDQNIDAVKKVQRKEKELEEKLLRQHEVIIGPKQIKAARTIIKKYRLLKQRREAMQKESGQNGKKDDFAGDRVEVLQKGFATQIVGKQLVTTAVLQVKGDGFILSKKLEANKSPLRKFSRLILPDLTVKAEEEQKIEVVSECSQQGEKGSPFVQRQTFLKPIVSLSSDSGEEGFN